MKPYKSPTDGAAAARLEDERNRRIHAETSWDAERALNRSALETIVSLSDWNTELQSEVKSLRQAVKELQDLATLEPVTEFSRTESNQG